MHEQSTTTDGPEVQPCRGPDQASFNINGMDYKPPVQQVLHHSTNAVIGRLRRGVVLKYPRYAWWDFPDSDRAKAAKLAFQVELKILRVLGEHQRIVQFLGLFELQGFLFTEAAFGSLQSFIDSHFDEICIQDKMTWRLQAAEAVAYIHKRGVIHSDLRPDNLLLCSTDNGVKSIRLCDFGGSVYGDMNGGHLPDAGFFDPRKPWVSTEQTDVFSLGSVFYTIMEGHWPHRARDQFADEVVNEYMTRVDDLFSRSIFPPVDHLKGGQIIHRCWNDGYTRAADIAEDHRILMST